MGRSRSKSLRRLVAKHKGNLSAIAAALGISRQAVTRRLGAAGLAEHAAAERVRAGVTGPRTADAVAATVDDEREQLLQALTETSSDEEARARLHISRRSLYRKKAKHKIDAGAVAAARARRASA